MELYGLKKGESGEGVKKLNIYLDFYFNNKLDNIQSFSNLENNKQVKATFDEYTEQQLKEFQRENNLLPTGILDKYTHSLITSPQCISNFNQPSFDIPVIKNHGMLPNEEIANANSNIFSFATVNPNEYGFFPKFHLTYAFVNDLPEVPLDTLTIIMNDITSQISHWIPPFSFEQVDSDEADIKIQFDSGYPFNNQIVPFENNVQLGVQLGVTFPPLRGMNTAKSYMYINNTRNWTLDFNLGRSDPNYYDIYTNLAHEFGHCLGLAHSKYRGTIMYKYPEDGYRRYTRDDIEGFSAIYNYVKNALHMI